MKIIISKVTAMEMVANEEHQGASPNIPDEIMFNILILLPVKSLLRFKSVCKNWYALIKSSTFVNTYQKHVLESRSSNDFIIVYVNPENSCFYTYHDAPEFTSRTDVVVNLPECEDPRAVLGSCNGLICFKLGRGRGLMLCNPVTREYFKFMETHKLYDRRHTFYTEHYGLGYDTVSNSYKIVKITSVFQRYTPLRCIVEVYKTDTNSWTKERILPLSKQISPRKYGVAVNNVLHWIASRRTVFGSKKSILTFDLHTEELGEMTYSTTFNEYMYEMLELMVANGYLHTIALNGSFCSVMMWVMKEYGVSESWTKLFVIRDGRICTNHVSVLVYRSRKKGHEVLLKIYVGNETYELVWYDVENESIKNVDDAARNREYDRGYMCIASLAPIRGHHDDNIVL